MSTSKVTIPSCRVSMDNLSAFGALGLAETGADLTNYTDELEKEKNLRALSIRRLKRSDSTGLLSTLKCKSHTPVQNRLAAYSTIDISKFPFLRPENAIQLVQSDDVQNIFTLCYNIQDFLGQNSVLLQDLFNSTDFLEAFAGALSKALNDGNVELINTLSGTIGILLQSTSEENNMALIDSGLSMSLYDFFSSENPDIVIAGLALSESISSSSVYGRDSILCLGLHTSLINLAADERYRETACSAILSIFSTFHCTDIAIVCECIEPMAQLLSSPPPSSQLILDAFIEMTNCGPSIGVFIYKCGLFPRLVSLLADSTLAPTAVRLVGNLAVGQPFQIQCLLESNLLEFLLPLIDEPKLTADVLWVLCNAVESYASAFFELFTSGAFLSQILGIAGDGGVEERREASYLLATVIIYGGETAVHLFLESGKLSDLTEAIVEMLGCGIGQNVKRCEDALLRLILAESQNRKEIVSALEDSDIRERCEELEEQDSPQIAQSAAYLINILDRFEGKDEE